MTSTAVSATPPPRDSLPPLRTAARLPRLRHRLEAARCEALLVTRLVNIRYLTGFSGSAALLLVLPDEAVFVTDGRYREQSAAQLEAAGVPARICASSPEGGRAAQRDALSAAARGVRRIGLEASGVSWADQRAYAAEWFPGAQLVPTEGLVEGLRRVKDDGELARIASAGAIADAAFGAIMPMLAEPITERDLALALDVGMRRRGAEGSAFETIVASGPNGARPHARPSDRSVRKGELVVLDFGAVVDGYCSDMTRTVCVGEPTSPVARRMVEVVMASQQAGVAAVASGVAGSAVDAACRRVITAAGWADAFVHGTGHGVGLEIHEDPRVSATSTDTLAVGHVVTVEPGVYLSEHGGARIEDTVVVTEEGCRPLTRAPKELTYS